MRGTLRVASIEYYRQSSFLERESERTPSAPRGSRVSSLRQRFFAAGQISARAQLTSARTSRSFSRVQTRHHSPPALPSVQAASRAAAAEPTLVRDDHVDAASRAVPHGSSPAPGARKRARTSSVVPVRCGEKLAVVRDFVKHEAGPRPLATTAGTGPGLSRARPASLRGALAGLRAPPRWQRASRGEVGQTEACASGTGRQRALVALAKLASTADGPRLRRRATRTCPSPDAEALDAGPARRRGGRGGGCVGARDAAPALRGGGHGRHGGRRGR